VEKEWSVSTIACHPGPSTVHRINPPEDLKDKVRSFFGPRDPQKKKDALPPKAHFSIWYFLIAFLLFTYLQQYFLLEKWRPFLTANSNKPSPKAT
jgi:hypothetical protein